MNLLRRLLWPADPGAFRLWLAMVVVAHHLTRVEIGKAPVLVFFALSGFWVQRVWHRQYALVPLPWPTFVISRWWRIAPLLVLSGLLSVAAMMAMRHPEWPLVTASLGRQALSGVMVLGYAHLPTRPVGPAWSLDIEMQFYLAAPLLLVAVRRCSAPLAMLGAVVVAELSLWAGQGVVLSAFLPWFVAGLLAAQHGWKVPRRAADASLALTLALFALALLSPWRALLLGANGAHYAWFNMLLAVLVLPFALAGVRRRGDRIDAAMADHSYLVYLLHWPAILLWRGVEWPSQTARWVALGGLTLAVALACLVVWYALDRPLQAARRRWVAGAAPLAPRARAKGRDSAALCA